MREKIFRVRKKISVREKIKKVREKICVRKKIKKVRKKQKKVRKKILAFQICSFFFLFDLVDFALYLNFFVALFDRKLTHDKI